MGGFLAFRGKLGDALCQQRRVLLDHSEQALCAINSQFKGQGGRHQPSISCSVALRKSPGRFRLTHFFLETSSRKPQT
jgi:hypothetical protein